MAEDIDIEEHDVLDNPVIRNIFPDISVIKKEISQYYEDVPDIKQEPETSTTTEKSSQDPVINTKEDKGVEVHKQYFDKNHAVKLPVDFGRKNNEQKKPFHGTKIIIGSKPNNTVKQTQGEVNKVNEGQNISLKSVVRIPKLLLQDLGEYIFQSNRYCEDCKTLFPSKLDFQEHIIKSHSVETHNKPTNVTLRKTFENRKNLCKICGYSFSCISSLNRHNKNIHKKTNTNTENRIENASYISSINKTNGEPNKCNLIDRKRNENAISTRKKHLNIRVTLDKTASEKTVNSKNKHKNVHEKKNTNIANCNENASYTASINDTNGISRKCDLIDCKRDENATSTRKKHLNSKVTLDKVTSIKKENKHLQNKNQTERNARLHNKCTICDSYFSNRANLNRHYKNIHKKKVSFKRKIDAYYAKLTHTMVSTNKKTRSQSKMTKVKTEYSCFHCNEQFLDQKCLIEHIYKVLESRQYPKHNRNKILSLAKKQYSPTVEINKEVSNTATEITRMKDKLIFEHPDSDGSNSSSSTTETNQKNNYNLETNMKRREKHTGFYKEKEKTERTPDARSVRQSLFTPSGNKRKRYLSDDDESSIDLGFLDTDETNENQPSQSKKKQKLETEYDYNNKKKKQKNTSNKHSTLKQKTEKYKNRRLTTLSTKTTHAVGFQPNKIKKDCLKGAFVYECIFCSYLLQSPRTYYMHMFWKHKLEKITRINKVIFDMQCKLCPSRTSMKNRNRHVRMYHYDLLMKPQYDETEDSQWRMEDKTARLINPEFKKVESFVLKSIVYKCTKCDIHFLSSCIAKDHDKHMELLINWKCTICKKIFKTHDKNLHLKQHKFSKTVSVCQFDPSELSRLLYNCTKCAIHFTEERYLAHYSKCDNQTTDSVYCKKCDILIDKCGYASHEDYHRTGANTTDIIVITGDIITKNEKQPKSQKRANGLVEANSEEGSHNQEKKEEIENVQIGATHYSPINCLTFCQTCKCYLSDIAVNRKSHIEGRCCDIVKYTCPTCGLVLTNKTINTHRDHHKKQKGLNLQDFEFFDLKGIQIRPPIPEYPSCNNCDVIFVGKNAVNRHICSETEHLTCEICNVKLSENAFKLHMNFHSYCMPNEKVVDRSLYFVPSKSQQTDIRVEEHAKALNPSSCADIMSSADKPKATVQKESQEQNMKVDTNIAIGSSNYNNSHTIEGTESPREERNLSIISTMIESESKNRTDNNAKSNIILYTCQSCKISVDTYEKVIQHCQNHFSPNPTIPSSKMCPKCSLEFEINTYEIHQSLHLCCNLLQVLIFDPTYFTSDNNIWTRHVFASVTPSKQKEVIMKSMYKHECRIKMEVVQQGPSNLTIHKCNKCGIYIEPDRLIPHLKVDCLKNFKSKHPCSVCGLPFISSLSRTEHEEIHKRHGNISLKSYNIILINCDAHNTYNASILNAMRQYVLYQCRTCDGIVEKFQRNDHKCNVDDLQKCLVCGLILYKDDFKRHISKHSDLALYNPANMKVILFGNKDESVSNKTLSSSFNGIISDYKLYKCNKCEECENDKKLITRHICSFDDSKWKCPKCGNFISARSIKQHIKMHDIDTEFNTENFMIINFCSSNPKNNSPDNTKEMSCGNNGGKNSNDSEADSKADHDGTKLERDLIKPQLDQNTANSSEHTTNNDHDKESIDLYKCACGLHYMDEMAAKNHVKLCCPKMKILRQNCSKCSLTFNPKELFAHILAHHGDKNKIFKYNVIEVKAEKV